MPVCSGNDVDADGSNFFRSHIIQLGGMLPSMTARAITLSGRATWWLGGVSRPRSLASMTLRAVSDSAHTPPLDAIKSLLGQGTFGKVVRCKDALRDREVAIKIIRSIQKYTDAAQIEIRVLKALRDNDPGNDK